MKGKLSMEENKEQKKQGIVLGDLYTFNQRLMQQMPALGKESLSLGFGSIGGWFSVHIKESYFMLLCRERYDFTTIHFKQHNYNKAVKELQEVIEERGQILSIDYIDEEDNYEIWIRDAEGETAMYKLFAYDAGVIEVI